MNLLVLSDLHIGPAARCRSMVPANEPSITNSDETKLTDEKLFSNLIQHIKSQGLTIDYILYPGDIADGGQLEQYDHFDIIANRLHAELKVEIENIFFTPGNHDVDWTDQKAGTTQDRNPSRWNQRFQPMMLSKALPRTAIGALYTEPFWTLWQQDAISVISVNTAAADGPSTQNHPGTISSSTFADLDNHLSSIKIAENNLKVLLIHHHPLQYANLFTGWKDFSVVQMENDLFDFCGRHRVDFIVHGHRHQPHFTKNICANGHEVSVLSAGSVSHNFPAYVYGNISNQYHIIKIRDRDPNVGIIRGELNSYSFSQIRKWQPSVERHDGIPGVIPFGPHIALQQVLTDSKKIILKEIANKNYCTHADLLAKISYYEYLNPSVIIHAIDSICNQENLHKFGAEISKMVIVREMK
ncbi:metallophosphoesterase family protein [Methylobacterium marchantiae]|uniref:Metallophosphoesterase family protein n=1 Tax=Methylobacterium marchantiae TaxID=600331 RepID=A0ABW3WZX5_9HYPH|nr:3',5'-cyclic adenosine monophosphate phosphodiesterase CpdA [Methylobacterium marchantiae]